MSRRNSEFGGGRGGGHRFGEGRGRWRRMDIGSGMGGDTCICINPQCRIEIPHQLGVPCTNITCPVCNSPMTRAMGQINFPNQYSIRNQSQKNFQAQKREKILPSDVTGEKQELFPVIQKDRCIGCGTCVQICPVRAIKLIDNKAVINYTYCRNCKICIPNCPEQAIKLGKMDLD